MEDFRKSPIVELQHLLDDARDLHGKYGNPGKPTLSRLLDPINGSPNSKRIGQLKALFEQFFITDLDELIRMLEDEIERRHSPDELSQMDHAVH